MKASEKGLPIYAKVKVLKFSKSYSYYFGRYEIMMRMLFGKKNMLKNE